MLEELGDLRESLFAVRMLREQILAAPLRPDAAARLAAHVLARNAVPPVRAGALRAAIAEGRTPGLARLDEAFLARLAGGAGRRTSPGTPFQGRAAPAPSRIAALTAEMLETLNAPVAAETWPPIVRAAAAHFLVRIVQPREANAAAHASLVEAALLAADGLPGDRVLLPEPDAGAEPPAPRPDPDAFVRARVNRLVERLGESADLVRAEHARAALCAWVDERGTGLNARQRRLVRWLAEGAPERSVGFREYVGLHAGRRAPSLRSLQRDWKGLRESGVLGERDERLVADPDALAYGTIRSSGPRGGGGGAGPFSSSPG